MNGTGSSVGVFTTDRDLVVRSWDPWLVEATGIACSAACGRRLGELFPELDERGLLVRLERVVAEGMVDVLAPAFHRYFLPCAPRESTAHFARMQQHVTLSPLREGREIVGAVVTIEDVTARLVRERELAEQLASHDEAIRLRAAQVLAEHDMTPGGAATPALSAALADESWRVRRVAARGLARGRGDDAVAALLESIRERHRDPAVMNATIEALTQSEHDVVPAVIELLGAPDADVRTYAALALGQLEDRRAVPALLRSLPDADTNVRYHAIEALGRIGSPEAAEPIAAIAASGDFFLAFVALDALGAMAEPSVARRLLPLLDDAALGTTVAEALARFGSEEVVAPIAALLGRPGVPAVPIATSLGMLYDRFEEAYGEGNLVADLARAVIAPDAVQALTAALSTATDAELGGLARVLSWLDYDSIDRVLAPLLAHATLRRPVAEMLASRGASAVDALVEVLGHVDDEARKAAAMALGRIGSPIAVPALLALLNDTAEVAVAAAGALGNIGDRRAFEPLLALLDRREPTVRQAAVSALSSIGHPDLPERVTGLLEHTSPRVRESAARIAGYFGYRHVLDRMLALAHDSEIAVRRTAIEHLAYFDDSRAVRTIVGALTTDAPAVRAAAARALAQCHERPALPALRAACRDPDPWVRYHAARSLGHHGDSDVLPALVTLADSDALPPVRIAAIDALGEIGNARALAVLAPLAGHNDPVIASAALNALGAVGTPEAMAPLLQALEGDDPERRLHALDAIGRPGRDEAVAVVAGLAREDTDRRVRERAVTTLAAIGSATAVAELIALSAEPRRRGPVIAALAQLGPLHVEAVGHGLEHPDPSVRLAVVEALARMKHRSAAPLLVAALEDTSPPVQASAAQALGRLDLGGTVPHSNAAGAGGEHATARWIGQHERASEARRE